MERLQRIISAIETTLITERGEICRDTITDLWPDLKASIINYMQRGIRHSQSNSETGGTPIAFYKSLLYARQKRENPLYNKFDIPERNFMHVNLGLTGAFYDSIDIIADEQEALIDATDNKWKVLSQRYGTDLIAPILRIVISQQILTEIRNDTQPLQQIRCIANKTMLPYTVIATIINNHRRTVKNLFAKLFSYLMTRIFHNNKKRPPPALSCTC